MTPRPYMPGVFALALLAINPGNVLVDVQAFGHGIPGNLSGHRHGGGAKHKRAKLFARTRGRRMRGGK